MAQSYQLTDDILITNRDNNLMLTLQDNQQYVIKDGTIFHLNDETELSSKERSLLCQEILHNLFSIPTASTINSAIIRQNTKNRFHAIINASNPNGSLQICLKKEDTTITVSQNSNVSFPTDRGKTSTKHNIHASVSPTEREYIDTTSSVISEYGEKFDDEHSISLKRSIKNHGRRIILKKEKLSYEDNGFIDQNSEQSSIEITTNEITKTLSIDDNKYKMKLKINYDLQKDLIECRLKKKEYDAIAIIEYKNTILTSKTGKKAKVTTLVDRDFDGQLVIRADNTFSYKQEQTGADGSLKKYQTQDDFTKIPLQMTQEIEKIKNVAHKIKILKNSQNNTKQLDFSHNPSIFDEEVQFSELKDKIFIKLADLLSRSDQENNNLLASVINVATLNSPIPPQNNHQRS